jgi:hypothetical protein
MHRTLWIAVILAVATGQAWAGPYPPRSHQLPGEPGPCYEQGLNFRTVPHDRPSSLTLEARRVKRTKGDSMSYDLGREVIVIKADSFGSRRFLDEVKKGRCSAQETVLLKPERISPFNKRFKAVNLPGH